MTAIHGTKDNALLQRANDFVRTFTEEADPHEFADFSAGGAGPDLKAYLYSHGIPDLFMCIFYGDSVGVGTGANDEVRKRAAWVSLGLQRALGDPADRADSCAWVKDCNLKGFLPLMEHTTWLLDEEAPWVEEVAAEAPLVKLARLAADIEKLRTEVQGPSQPAPPRPSRRGGNEAAGASGRPA